MRLEVRENTSILRLMAALFIAVGVSMAVCSVLIIWGGGGLSHGRMDAHDKRGSGL